MVDTLINSLTKAGMRLTSTRVAICNYLAGSQDHPTAAQIYAALKPDYPSLSLATVYNTLDVLVNAGAVNVLGQIGDGNVHFDPDTHPHINLACLKCHEIVDFTSQHTVEMEEIIRKESGYQIVGSRMVHYGICPACQESQNSEPTA
ncbi:MAG: transcriptional repressor [Anaerolineae bacterium]|nr:transcriptional repressor [Anaerolineae bacterium]